MRARHARSSSSLCLIVCPTLRLNLVLSLCLIPCLVSVPASSAWPQLDPPIRYALSAKSEYEEGCFDPCMCPILLASDLEGAFSLEALEPQGTWEVHAVQDVAWDVIFFGELFRRAVGDGTYRVDTAHGLQQMVLELRVNAGEPLRFDSGVVPVEVQWPALALSVSRNGMFCYDEVYHVHAAPAGPISVEADLRWGTLKSMYR